MSLGPTDGAYALAVEIDTSYIYHSDSSLFSFV